MLPVAVLFLDSDIQRFLDIHTARAHSEQSSSFSRNLGATQLGLENGMYFYNAVHIKKKPDYLSGFFAVYLLGDKN